MSNVSDYFDMSSTVMGDIKVYLLIRFKPMFHLNRTIGRGNMFQMDREGSYWRLRKFMRVVYGYSKFGQHKASQHNHAAVFDNVYTYSFSLERIESNLPSKSSSLWHM